MTSIDCTLTLARESSGRYHLVGAAVPVRLQVSGWRSKATAFVGGDEYVLRMSGFLDRGVSLLRAGQDEPVMRLARRSCVVPGVPGCRWRTRARWRGYEGRLTSPQAGSVQLSVGHGGRSGVDITVSGDWPQRDLTALVAAFAVLMRRRDDESAAAGAASGAVIASG